MWKNLLNLFKEEDLYTQALEKSYQMLDMDYEMYEASVQTLRHSHSQEIGIDVYKMDKQINAYEREVRKKVMTHLAVTGSADLVSGLVLVSVVIDIERIGDYTKNIYDLATNHPTQLIADSIEEELSRIETTVTSQFKNMITAFKKSDEKLARKGMEEYKEEVSKACDTITHGVVRGNFPELDASTGSAVALYARYLKRIAAHSRNIVTSVVNPFDRIGYPFSEDS
jgi:phosphate transport system protein